MRLLPVCLSTLPIALSAIFMEHKSEGTILVDGSGKALISRMEYVPASALASLYRIHWEYVEKSGEEQDFFSQASTELKFLLPVELAWDSAQRDRETDSLFRTMEGKINGFSVHRSGDDLWTIETGPSEKLMEKYFELIFSQMMFQTVFLESHGKPSKEFQDHSVTEQLLTRRSQKSSYPKAQKPTTSEQLG